MAWTFYNSSGEAMIEDGAMSIANNTNNRVVTATGADPASLDGEANLTFDGTNLTVGTGNVIVGTAGKGIDFSNQASPAAGMTAELLDRYEEGTWTPVIMFTTTNSSYTYGVQTGTYTRIGRQVFIQGRLDSDGGSATSSGAAKISGLPFTSNAASYSFGGISYFRGISFADRITFMLAAGSVVFDFYETTNAGAASTITDSNFSLPFQMFFFGSYFI
jgi:hypothetical protein